MRIHQRQGDLYPDDDETYEDFMDRCTDEIGDEDVCQLIWDDRGAKDGTSATRPMPARSTASSSCCRTRRPTAWAT